MMPDSYNYLTLLNPSTIATEAKQELTTSMPVFTSKIPHFRTYVNNIDEAIDDNMKSIEKLHYLFKNIQTNSNDLKTNQTSAFEIIKKLTKSVNDSELQLFYEKFFDISKILNDNIKNFVNNLTNKSLNPLEQLLKTDDKTLNQLKKNVDKSIKSYESKCKDKMKQSKERIDRTGVHDEIHEEIYDEKCTVALRLCEYLLGTNEIKTNTCNELTNCLLNYFRAQLEYFNQSMQIITNYSNYFTKLEQYMVNFKHKQETEREKLLDTINHITTTVPTKSQVDIHSVNTSTQSIPSIKKQNSNNSIITISAGTSTATATSADTYHLHQLKTNKSYGTSKTGYLYKHASRNRVRKHWMKRKCVVENGLFLIYHSDQAKDPVILKLITCQMKFVDNRRFKVFSGSNSRIYDFMTETEEELNEWVSVLNNSKSEALSNALSSDQFDESVKELNNNILKKIKKLDGNDRCCDCSAPDPEWLVTNLGILICIECCGIHRELGVHLSKTQSIKIDRLSTSQLIIARMTGNFKFNCIFEASIDASQKLNSTSNMETRRRYIRQKYELHKFSKNYYSVETLYKTIDLIGRNDHKQIYETLLQIFAQNIELLTPIEPDEKKRNVLQLVLIQIDETSHLHIVDFIVQNREFTKKYNINYQDQDGNTALHYCAIKNRVESMKILLKANIDYNLKNKDGLTAYEQAYKLMNFDCAKQIKQLIKTNKIDDVEWMGVFDEDYLSDTIDDSELTSLRTRPASMISFKNFITPTSNTDGASYGMNSSIIKQKKTNQRSPSESFDVSSPTQQNRTNLNNSKVSLKAMESRLDDKKNSSLSINNISTSEFTITKSQLVNMKSQKSVDEVDKQQMFSLPIKNTETFVWAPSTTNKTNKSVFNDKSKLPVASYKNTYQSTFKCRAIKTYQTTQYNHLSFNENDVIVVLSRIARDLWEGYVETKPEKCGLFPPTYVNIYV